MKSSLLQESHDEFIPYKTYVAVYNLLGEERKRSLWFEGLVLQTTTRGLVIMPKSEWGTSLEVQAGSWIPWEQYSTNPIEIKVIKRMR